MFAVTVPALLCKRRCSMGPLNRGNAGNLAFDVHWLSCRLWVERTQPALCIGIVHVHWHSSSDGCGPYVAACVACIRIGIAVMIFYALLHRKPQLLQYMQSASCAATWCEFTQAAVCIGSGIGSWAVCVR
jgi:hypothetical protein